MSARVLHRRWMLALLTLATVAAAACGNENGQLAARLLAPRALAEQAQSVVIHVLDGLRVDGSPVACSSVLEDGPFSPDFYLLSTSVVDVGAGTEEVTIDGVPVGEARVFYVEVYDRPGGLNRVIAQGCTARVDVSSDEPAQVDVTLQPVP